MPPNIALSEWSTLPHVALHGGVRRTTASNGQPALVTPGGHFVTVSPGSVRIIDKLEEGCTGYELISLVVIPSGSEFPAGEARLLEFLNGLRDAGVLTLEPVVSSAPFDRLMRSMGVDFLKRIPIIGDPSVYFHAIGARVRSVIPPAAGIAIACLVVAGGVWGASAASIPAVWPEPYMLFVLVIVLAVQVIFHEFAHALVMGYLGVRVGEMGIGLMLFVAPVAYVDRTDSYQLRSRIGRLMISLAGPLSDCGAIAASGVLARVLPPPQASFFHLLAILQIYLLAVNLNPLFRSDGYHALEAAVGGLNIRTRAFVFVAHSITRRPLPAYLTNATVGVRVLYVIYVSASTVYSALLALGFVRAAIVLGATLWKFLGA